MRFPELRPCARCLRCTRPKSRKAAEYPFETVTRGDAEHCQSCRLLILGITKGSQRPAIGRTAPGPANPQTLRGLARYVIARRQRLTAGSGAR